MGFLWMVNGHILELERKVSGDELDEILIGKNDPVENLRSIIDYFDSSGADPDKVRAAYGELKRLKSSLFKDPLTGLYNRGYFNDSLAGEISRVGRRGKHSSLVMCDIDYFKKFNDNFGHLAGDRVLKGVSKVIMESGRKEDSSCRYGGEEFAIILPGASGDGAYAFADNLRKNIKSKEWFYDGDYLGQVTISAGVSDIVAGERIEDVISRADSALYSAKNGGRDRVSLYDKMKELI
jgi:diguanylate cyclase (GGDEF)-like protein